MALSYNSMAIISLILCITFVGPDERFVRANYILAGISFSAAVLCCPYLALVYFVYILSVVIRTAISKRSAVAFKCNSPLFSIR